MGEVLKWYFVVPEGFSEGVFGGVRKDKRQIRKIGVNNQRPFEFFLLQHYFINAVIETVGRGFRFGGLSGTASST